MMMNQSTQQSQNKQAFIQFYTENYSWLFNWLRKKLQNGSKAEDILQDTFTKILSLERLPYIQEAKAYLTVTASRIIIDQARKEKIEQLYLQYLIENQYEEDECSPEQMLISVDLLNRIANVLCGLDERSRKVLLLYHIEGKTQAEIALILNITRKTVKADLVKALMYCNRRLKSEI
ncbi:MAG: RNA polymerase sigma factor [Acinetobacter populi]|jgi:RNA polymerase sigma-70 factor (ECF subfamily)|uniref:RNA polymerase sigma factor n=1 Tax=Acinetobacter populi TaxID=1582270 RepID=UPI002355A328|nr:RNA polymerase sigma factor [Acinetobacter populi]MCH4247819.1 RNA polymerase sigma factor [Acinetobacter populi]